DHRPNEVASDVGWPDCAASEKSRMQRRVDGHTNRLGCRAGRGRFLDAHPLARLAVAEFAEDRGQQLDHWWWQFRGQVIGLQQLRRTLLHDGDFCLAVADNRDVDIVESTFEGR